MDEFHRSAGSLDEELTLAIDDAEETLASVNTLIGDISQKYNISADDYEELESDYSPALKTDQFKKSEPEPVKAQAAPPPPPQVQPQQAPPPPPPPTPKVTRAPIKTPNVIVPEEGPETKAAVPPPAAPAKKSSRIQRVKRGSDVEAQPAPPPPERKAPAPPPPPPVRSQTRPLQPIKLAQTKELKDNIKEISHTVQEAKKGFKQLAASLTMNFRGATTEATRKVLDGGRKMLEKVSMLFNRSQPQPEAPRSMKLREEDFEDAPTPAEAEPPPAPVNYYPPPPAQEAPETRLFNQVPSVAPTLYADLLKQHIVFLSLNKEPLVPNPHKLTPDEIQDIFVEKGLYEIRSSAQFVASFSPPEEGPYKDIPVGYVFAKVRQRDLFLFLLYVSQHPQVFKHKKYKLAEAFASWVLKKSHEVDVSEASSYDYNEYEDYEAPPQPAAQPEPELPQEDVPDEIPPLLYADLLQQNIVFYSMNRESLIGNPKLHPDVIQSLFMQKALVEIKGCVKLVEKLPTPTQGPYAGFPLADIFNTVQDQDVHYFLHFVKTNPHLFRGKEYRLAEAFASWIIKNSHETELYDPLKHAHLDQQAAPLPERKLPEVIPPVLYTELLKMDIAFLTFDKQPLIDTSYASLEEIQSHFLQNVTRDVRSCIKFVQKLPPLQEGPYAGFAVAEIFRNVQPQDIYFFLHYVRQKPKMFQGKTFKFSEAFASWLIKRSHATEIKA